MKIKLTSSSDGYMFAIENNGCTIFASNRDYRLIPSFHPTYRYPWEAYQDATSLMDKSSKQYHLNAIKIAREDLTKTVVTDMSAEEMLVDHYSNLFKMMKTKVRGGLQDKDEMQYTYDELAMIEKEIDAVIENVEDEEENNDDKILLRHTKEMFTGLINKHFKKHRLKDIADQKKEQEEAAAMPEPPAIPPAMPQGQPPAMPPAQATRRRAIRTGGKHECDKGMKNGLYTEYANKTCQAIFPQNPNIVFETYDDDETIVIYELVNGKKEPFIVVGINDETLNVNSILPYGRNQDLYPLHSLEFYQRYWKPIVESIGHFFIEDASTLIIASEQRFPDIPKSTPKIHTLKGWCPRSMSGKDVDIAFRGDDPPTWLFESSSDKSESQTKTAQSKYTEQEYANAMVKCIDSSLESIHGRVGEVIQVLPGMNFIELDVDFGRGIGIVRLTEDKIEKVL